MMHVTTQPLESILDVHHRFLWPDMHIDVLVEDMHYVGPVLA